MKRVPMNFASDNVYGIDPRIMAAVTEANSGTARSYGADDLSVAAEAKLSEIFETPVRAFLVATGTAANGLALSSISSAFGAIICHAEAHIFCDECNAPEFFTGGAKLLGLPGRQGKITPALIESCLKSFVRGEHDPKPMAVSITNASELGTVYSPNEIRAIADLVKPRGLRLHMDGARFANAVAGQGVTPAELTWKAGVDVMSFGGTKNGAMLLEAVVFFDCALAEDFSHRRMRAGQLMSKGRFLGAQMLAYLEDGRWIENANKANSLARRLGAGLADFPALRLYAPVEANEVFALMPEALYDKLLNSGVVCGRWIAAGVDEGEALVRFVVSFATPEDSVDRLLSLLPEIT